MKDDNPDLEVILVPGDIVTHGLAQDIEGSSKELYQQLLDTLDTVSGLFEKYFSQVLVLPTVGNNDTKYHYQPPETNDKHEYLTDLTQWWFQNHSANKNLPNL